MKFIYKITFSRNGYVRKDGTRQIVITCYKDKKTAQIGTNIFVRKEQFSNGIVINHELANEYNDYIYNKRNEIEALELTQIKNKKIVTHKKIKALIKDGVSPNMKLNKFIENVNKTSTTRCEKTKAHYESLSKRLNDYQKDSNIQDIDSEWVNKYILWERKNNMSHNTIVGRLKSLKAIINEAIKRNIISQSNNPFKHIKIPQMKNRDEFLTSDELKKIEKLRLNGKENKIRNAFLFACYTGFRFSDLNTLTKDNITLINGKQWIVKKPLKTLESSSITVKIPIYRIFDGKPLKMIEDSKSIESLTHIGNNASANRTLKGILSKANIAKDKHITFHTARHTTATLLLSQNVPITTVQKILGHTKIETTQIYAKVTNNIVKKDIECAFPKKKLKC